MPPIDIPVAVALPDDAYFITRNFIINIQQLKFTEAGPVFRGHPARRRIAGEHSVAGEKSAAPRGGVKFDLR